MTAAVSANACSICGGIIDAGRVCRRCASSFSAGEAERTAPTRVGDYALIQLLGEGGMGEVYLAQSLETEALVALKLARPELLASDAGAIAFRWELRAAQRINHPNIVRIHSLGTLGIRPYLVMDLLEGGTLAERSPWNDQSNDAILSFMIKIVQAVQHAHSRGVLHCDLKPANVLFDGDQEPYVSDFGMARALSLADEGARAFVSGGSIGWMAPEQVRGEGALTTQTDVFSLGLLLHWVLTGEHAFGCDSNFERRVLSEAPASLSQLPCWELRAVCERALQKRPEDRYPAAGDLARDLVRVRDGVPIQAEHQLRFRKLSKWVRRHVFVATLAIELLLLLAYVAVVPFSVVDELGEHVRSEMIYAARVQAGNIAYELRLRADSVLELARQPELRRELTACDLTRASATLATLAPEFDSLWAFRLDGEFCRSWPQPRTHLELFYEWRDYFIGQRQLAEARVRAVYVARVIRDDVDSELKLAYATPVFDQDDTPVGVLVATTKTRATFGSVQMNCTGEGNCMTALLAPRDRDGRGTVRPEQLIVVAEPGLAAGRQVVVPVPLATKICKQLGCQSQVFDVFAPSAPDAVIVDEHFRDPIHGHESLAAVAAVAHTGMSVVVATPHDGIAALGRRIDTRLRSWLWLPLLAGVCVIGGLVGVTAIPAMRARKRSSVRKRSMGLR